MQRHNGGNRRKGGGQCHRKHEAPCDLWFFLQCACSFGRSLLNCFADLRTVSRSKGRFLLYASCSLSCLPGEACLRKGAALDHRRWLLQIRNQPSADEWQEGHALSVALVTVTRRPVATGPATDLYAHLVGNDADFSNAPTDPIFGDSAGVGHRPSRRQNSDRGLYNGALNKWPA